MLRVRSLQVEEGPVADAFLAEHLSSSLYMRYNLDRGGLTFGGAPYQAEYFGVFRDQALIGLLSHTWLDTLLVQAPSREGLHQLEGAVPRLLTRPIRGVVGPRDQCLELMERLSLDHAGAALDQDEPIYRLELSRLRRPPGFPEPGYRVRPPKLSELPLLAGWRKDYLREIVQLASEPGLEVRAAAEVAQATREERAFVLEQGGEPMAYCSFTAMVPEAVQLAGVWTPPHLRGRGYSQCVMAGALEHARDVRGHRTGVIFVDDENRPALKATESIGFQREGRFSFTLWEPGREPWGP